MFSIQIAKTPFRGQQKGGTQCVFLGFKLHVFWEYNSGILLGFLEQKESSAVLGSKFAQIKWVPMSPAIRFSTGFTIYFYRGFQFALILGSKFHANTLTGSSQTGDKNTHIPRCSMYGICAYIYHKSKPNVGVYIYIYIYLYTIHEAYMIYTHTNPAGYLPLCTDLGNLSRLCECSSKSGGPPRSIRQKDSIFAVIPLGKIETKIKVHSIHGTGMFTFIYPKNQPSEGIYIYCYISDSELLI